MIKTLLLIKGEEKERAPEKWVKVVRDWIRKNTAVMSLNSKYWNLNNDTKLVILLSSLAVAASIFDFLQPSSNSQLSGWLQLSFLLLGGAVLVTMYYVWSLHSLTSIIARFEAGTPIEEIVTMLPTPTTPT